MSMPTREGLFNAYPLSIGCDDTGPNNLATVTVHFGIVEELQKGDLPPTDITAESLEITGYFYLEKKDGSLNMNAIKSLREAFGWDGLDPFWLQDNGEVLGQKPVQLNLRNETYEGRTSIRVAFLNPYGAEPRSDGVTYASTETATGIRNRLGSKLAANAGGSSLPAARPTPPSRPVAAPPSSPTPPAGITTLDEAWATFAAACPEQLNQTQMEEEWFKVLAQLFPGRDVSLLTAQEWYTMKIEGVKHITPF